MSAQATIEPSTQRDALIAENMRINPPKIVRRIYVIENEQTVKEAVIFDFDSYRNANRKLKGILKH
jgi:hypothetical protein